MTGPILDPWVALVATLAPWALVLALLVFGAVLVVSAASRDAEAEADRGRDREDGR